MKTVELRRHSIRGDGKDLSPFGVQLARDARLSLAPRYALVLTSPKRRCRQTVEAFGFKRYLLEDRLAPLDYGAFKTFDKSIERLRSKKRVGWLEAAFRVPEALAALKEAGRGALKTAADIASFLNDGEHALAVTHADIPELAALFAFETYDLKRLGRPFSFCEGAALRFNGVDLVRADPLRLSAPPPREVKP